MSGFRRSALFSLITPLFYDRNDISHSVSYQPATRVRLFGIDAPELKQKCKHPNGRDFLCGRAAASFLLEHVRGGTVECRGNSEDRYGRLIAVCFVGGKDLNAMMVGEGWALAYRDYSENYVPQENAARGARRGIWAMQFVPPWEWRRMKR